MPTNKKEGMIFTTLMCCLMVLGMSIYNLWIHNSFSIASLVIGFIPGFIVAFILDVFIVGTVAKKIAFKLPINHDNKVVLILTISTLMILGMVTFMSMFGVIMENGISSNLLNDYLYAWRMNIIAAWPLQIVLVGPFSRKMLKLMQAQTATA